jgi:hypothetical protein
MCDARELHKASSHFKTILIPSAIQTTRNSPYPWGSKDGGGKELAMMVVDKLGPFKNKAHMAARIFGTAYLESVDLPVE